VFGDLASGLWGAAWLPGGDEDGFVCIGADGATALVSARVEGGDEVADWRLLDDGTDLTVSPVGDPVSAPTPNEAPGGFDQLCRVCGQITLGGVEHAVDCLGRRAARPADLDVGALDSVRDVSAWFEPGDGLALVAVRPRKARGQEADVMTAAVLDAESAVAVNDPRLSTTYSATGRPTRASFELWLGDGEHEYPRRASGVAVGPHAGRVTGALEIEAELFRWHSRGREGAGVYLLARRV
jgi:hypothetical protein